MHTEKSCGAVVFTKTDGETKYLLIQNRNGIYGFPKGHVEGNETEIETALREVREETGLSVALLPGFRTEDAHPVREKEDTMKYITYFVGYYEDQTPVYQKSELLSAALYTYEEAMGLFQRESAKRILAEADAFLKTVKG